VWGAVIDSMSSLATVLDTANDDQRYQNTLKEQLTKIQSPELSPSAQVLSTMKQESLSWLDFTGELSKKHKVILTKDTQKNSNNFITSVQQSFSEANRIKKQDILPFEQFMQNYQAE